MTALCASNGAPAARSARSPSRQSVVANAIASVAPIETRMAFRYNGSAQRGESTRPAAPNAAAFRKTAPTLSGSVTSSRPSTRREPAGSTTAGAEIGGPSSPRARQPRWNVKPTTARMVSAEASYRWTDGRLPIASPRSSSTPRVARTERTVKRLSSSRRTTSRPSARNSPARRTRPSRAPR